MRYNSPKPASRRRGVALVLFVVMAFALLALAALVIDLGFAFTTRSQMQGAVESAALEGLRDFAPNDPSKDLAAREEARRRLFLVFDDDLDPENGFPLSYGAGPVLELSGGIPLGDSDFHASQLLDVPSRPRDGGDPLPHAYNPADPRWPFQLNVDNEAGGDMVRGFFDAGDGLAHGESSDYERDDFVPDANGPALLVRMRRSGEALSDSRSSGPTLPFLFGRGSFLNLQTRAKGISVRATAIAEGRPALSVGPAYPPGMYADAETPFEGRRGRAPFALTLGFWNGLAVNVAQTLDVDDNGKLHKEGTPDAGHVLQVTSLAAELDASATTMQVKAAVGFPAQAPFRVRIGAELMRVVEVNGTTWTVERGAEETQAAAHADKDPLLLQEDIVFGQNRGDVQSLRPDQLDRLGNEAFHAYVPIFEPNTGGIAGFGLVEWNVEAWGSGMPAAYKIRIVKQATFAAVNASAAPGRSLSHLDDAVFEGLYEAHRAIVEPLRAPALVR